MNQTPQERPAAPLLIFDIETVPDIPLLYMHYEPALEGGWDPSRDWRDVCVPEAIRVQKNLNFPPPIFHCVISICALFVDPETHQIIDGFRKSVPVPQSYAELLSGEAQLLSDFWAFTIKKKDKLKNWYDSLQSDYRLSDYQRRKLKPIPLTFCGYNISGFDLPVLEQRSMKNFITCPIPEYGREWGYDSYRSKYAFDKCFDLLHYISGNAVGRSGLDILARSMGLGGKMTGMDGSRVAAEYYENRAWEKIEEYCAVDVLITYGVYLALQKFRGFLDAQQFRECTQQFLLFLNKEGKPAAYAELARESHAFFAAADSDTLK